MKKANADQIVEVGRVLVTNERGFDIAQAVISRQHRILEGPAVGCTSSELYKDEEVASTYGYSKDYAIGAAVQEAAKLKERFGKLDVSHVEQLASGLMVPSGWDGLVVMPKFSAVTPVHANKARCWDPFNLAMERLFGLMKEARSDFYDYTEGNIGPEYLRPDWRTMGAYSHLERVTPGDVLVFPAQTGIRHRGKSVRRSRVVLAHNEFGLDSFAVGTVVFLRPQRLQSADVLWVDCPGAEYSPDADGSFECAPYWVWNGGELKFSWNDVRSFSASCGSASALLPE